MSDTSTSRDLDAELERAGDCLRGGRVDEAEQAYRRVLDAAPDQVAAHFGLALALAWSAGHDAAFTHLDAALQALSNDGRLWGRYIDALRSSGRADDARRALAHAQCRGVTLSADDPDASVLSARADAILGAELTDMLTGFIDADQFADAALVARRMAELLPAAGLRCRMLRTALSRRGDHAAVIDALLNALECMPGDPDVRRELDAVLGALTTT